MREALKAVMHPVKRQDIVSLNMVSGITVHDDGHASFAIEINPQEAAAMESVRQQAQDAVVALSGIKKATAVLTAHTAPRPQTAPGPRHGHGNPNEKIILPNIKHIVAVASGKGGVGKSTTAVNLAVAAAQNGLKVGVLDADIYGPSLPRMMGLSGKPDAGADKRIIPLRNHGVVVMSIGFMVPEERPVIWRGPMVMGAIQQLLRDVDWGELDLLVVDMPPGTGDAQLTMAQSVTLSGAVIVSTPQDIALLDARKGIMMFQKVGVPILGVLENMSYFLCPHCGERSDVFSHGGAKQEAEKFGVPYLGGVPLNISIRETSDAGTPITTAQPESEFAQIYKKTAYMIWNSLAQDIFAAEARS